jgi:hypothetical protein
MPTLAPGEQAMSGDSERVSPQRLHDHEIDEGTLVAQLGSVGTGSSLTLSSAF